MIPRVLIIERFPDLIPADEPWTCSECRRQNWPDDDGFIRTGRGPLCGVCAEPDYGRAA